MVSPNQRSARPSEAVAVQAAEGAGERGRKTRGGRRSEAGTSHRGLLPRNLRISARASRDWKTAAHRSPAPRACGLRSQTPRTRRCLPGRPGARRPLGVRGGRGAGPRQARGRSRGPGQRRGRGRGSRKPRGCAPVSVGFPAAARPAPSLPVVAVIFERREVLLQLAVRLLQPLTQVLELAAERGLEGVLGVHARAGRRRAPSRAPEPLRPLRRPLCRFLRPLFSSQLRGSGLPARWAGPRRRSR